MAAPVVNNVDDYVNVEEPQEDQKQEVEQKAAPPPEEKKEPARRTSSFCKFAVFMGLVGLALLALVERRGVVAACGRGKIAPVWYFHTVRGQPLDVPAGTNCLGTASRWGHARLAEWVVDQGAANASRVTLADGYSAAHLAGISPAGDEAGAAVLDVLRRKGFPLGLRDRRGNTPCKVAARLGRPRSVKVLCEAGECASEDAPLASGFGHVLVLKALDKCGVSLAKGKEAYTLASAAAEQDRTDVLEFLSEKGQDFNELNNDGTTALHHAVKNSHPNSVRVLQAGGANLTDAGKTGRTPLFLALATDEEGETVDALLSFGGQAAGVDLRFEGWTPATVAAGLGRDKTLASLIRSGADLRKSGSKTGATPAYVAAEHGHTRSLDLIAASNPGGGPALLELPNVNKYTALHIATQNGHGETVARLRELGVRVDRADILGRMPQTVAVEYGHPELAESLFLALPAGEKRERIGWKMLEEAAERADLATLRFLNGQGVPLDRRVKGERDRLAVVASKKGNLEALKFIVENHPSLDLSGEKSQRIALPAAMNDHLDVIKYLVGEKGVPVTSDLVTMANLKGGEAMAEFLSARADLDKPDGDGDTPCQIAAIGGNRATIANLCSGPRLHQRNRQNNRTLLFSSALHGHDELSAALLAAGVDPDLPDTKGNTPAHASIQQGDRTAVLEAIVAHGGRLGLPNQNNFTPLHMAALKDRPLCTEYLIGRQVPLDTPDSDGDTPACVAASAGHTAVLRTLHRAGASLEHSCQKGYSLAHTAAYYDREEALSYIIKHGSPAQLTRRLEGGQTPLDLAAEEGELGAVRVLAQEGKVPLDVPNPATGLTPAAAAGAKGQALAKIAIELLMKEREEGEEEGTDRGEDADDGDDGATPEEGDEDGDEDRKEMARKVKRLQELLTLLEDGLSS